MSKEEKKEESKVSDSLGSLLVLDVTRELLNSLTQKFTSLHVTGVGNAPGETYPKRLQIVASGIKATCGIFNKEMFIVGCKKKYDTIIINSNLGSVKNKPAFLAALKKISNTIVYAGNEIEGFTKSGKMPIGKKDYNIFKN